MIAAGIVTLRPWQPSDASFVYFSCQDEDLRRWTGLPSPYRAGDASAFVSRHARRQPEEAAAYFAVTRTDTGELLGAISFTTIDRARRRASAGYWIAAEARGQGFATAALEGLAQWGFDELGLDEIGLVVDADNTASQRVAGKAGFAPTPWPEDGKVLFRRRTAD